MADGEKTIVISDIHISNGQEYSWFQARHASRFVDMLNAVAEGNAPFDGVNELVLLGDFFDLWLYPVNEIPWTAGQILANNPAVEMALGKCVENIPHVYYLNGNHDMDVTDHDAGLLNGKIQRIHTSYYKELHPFRHLEHGHMADMFNAPDNSGDTLGGYPLGYYITRLAATAQDQNQIYRFLRDLYGKLHDVLSMVHLAAAPRFAAPPGVFMPETFAAAGSLIVQTIISSLRTLADVEKETVIKISNDDLKNRFGGAPPTVGAVMEKYGSLCGSWCAQHGLKNLLNAMLATEGLDWYAQDILAANSDLKVVVMGHTHASTSDSPYDNDGCWCDSSVFGHDHAAPTYVEIIGDKGSSRIWNKPV